MVVGKHLNSAMKTYGWRYTGTVSADENSIDIYYVQPGDRMIARVTTDGTFCIECVNTAGEVLKVDDGVTKEDILKFIDASDKVTNLREFFSRARVLPALNYKFLRDIGLDVNLFTLYQTKELGICRVVTTGSGVQMKSIFGKQRIVTVNPIKFLTGEVTVYEQRNNGVFDVVRTLIDCCACLYNRMSIYNIHYCDVVQFEDRYIVKCGASCYAEITPDASSIILYQAEAPNGGVRVKDLPQDMRINLPKSLLRDCAFYVSELNIEYAVIEMLQEGSGGYYA